MVVQGQAVLKNSAMINAAAGVTYSVIGRGLGAQPLNLRPTGFPFEGSVFHACWDARWHAIGGTVIQFLNLLAKFFQAKRLIAVLAALLL